MTESEAKAVLWRISWLEAILCDADEYGDYCESRIAAWRKELNALREDYATQWIGG